ncbi:MAG TPA: recombinase family protein [Clostridium sp.]
MNVVGYVRLSRDDDNENVTSINTQQDIIKEYASENNWNVSKIYIDDNYSGYNFNRPDFKEMMIEVGKGNIDIILAKDASRIGRRNGQTLVMFDEITEASTRLILITEADGGLDVSKDDNNILGIKTWFNDFYIKDVSRKIRLHMHSMQKAGTLIMGNHYGYTKVKSVVVVKEEKVLNSDNIDSKEKISVVYTLEIDEDLRPGIELIFKSYISGMGYKRVCDVMDEMGYPTPSEFIRQKHTANNEIFKNKTSSIWQTHMIARIIQDDVYIGTLRTKKRQSLRIKGKQQKVAKEDQYVFEDHHKGIISKEDFKLAQEINVKRADKSCRASMAKYNYFFTSFMRCGNCNSSLSGVNLRKVPEVLKGYNCTMYIKYGKKHCVNHAVKEERVWFFFKEFLKNIKTEYEEYISSIKTIEKKNMLQNTLANAEKELSIADEEHKLLIKQKMRALMREKVEERMVTIEKAFDDLLDEKIKSVTNLNHRISELKKLTTSDVEDSIKNNIIIFDSIINAEVPDRKDLEIILDKILVYEDKSLEFILKVSIERLTYSDVI